MSENGQVTPDVTEEEERRRRPAGAWLRIGIAGAAIIGIGAGLTSALWTDQVDVAINGAVADEVDLWVRAHVEDAITPRDGTNTWAASVTLDLGNAVIPDKYEREVDVYNDSDSTVTVTFDDGTPALPAGVTVASTVPTTIGPNSKETYTITVDTRDMQPEAAKEEIAITATYTGTPTD